MKEKLKKLLSSVIVATMILTCAPMSGFVGLKFNINIDWMNYIFSCLIMKSSAEECLLTSTGQCGDNAYWKFDEKTGTLTISGTGEMWDFSKEEKSPFASDSNIIRLIVDENIESIGDYLFYDCQCLKEIILLDGLYCIGENAFCNCISLSFANIPDTVFAIEEDAFEGCIGLKSISIGKNAYAISTGVFNECYNVEQIYFNASSLTLYKRLFENVGAFSKNIEIIIGPDVTKIPEGLFSDSGAKSIIIHNEVEKIDSGLFYGCPYFSDIYFCGTEIDWKNIVIDSSYNERLLNSEIHYNYDALNVIPTASGKCGDDVYYFLNSDGLLTVFGSGEMYGIDYETLNYLSVLNIKNIVIEKGVTSYTAYFNDCNFYYGDYFVSSLYQLQQVTFSNTVKLIDDIAFSGCHNLNKVILETDSQLKSIGEYAFAGTMLTDISFLNNASSVTLKEYSFTDCLFSNLVIPDSVYEIYDGAFSMNMFLEYVYIGKNANFVGCGIFYNNCFNDNDITQQLKEINVDKQNKYLANDSYGVLYNKNYTELIQYPVGNTRTSFVIPDSVKNIDVYAFFSCKWLENINIPDSVTDIGNETFSWCTGLTSVVIPNSITNIGAYEFCCCGGLTSVTIPNSVTNIDKFAFNRCDNLADIYYTGDKEDWNSIKIEDYNNSLLNATIHFNYTPSGSYTVTFNPNGGTVSPASTTSKENVTLPTPTRDGYTCLGWSEDSKETVAAYPYGAEYKPQSDITLYAVWKANSYTIKFYDNSTLLGSKSLKFDEFGTLSYGTIPTKSGYQFVGWSTVNGGPALFSNGQLIKGLAKNDGAVVSYYAVWEKDEKEVVVDKDTGIVLDAPADAFEGEATLKIETVLSGSAFDIVANQTDGLKSSIFSIETYVDGVKTQPNGYVTVKIPVPHGFDAKKCKLYYVNTDKGVAEEISIEIENGFIVFQTNHFSNWAVVEINGKVKSVSINNIEMNYKSSAKLNSVINADNGVDYTIEYKSSNTKVVSVDKNGNVYGGKKGNATITCTVTDEFGNSVSDTCSVNVKYSGLQWVIVILLFGWIWY